MWAVSKETAKSNTYAEFHREVEVSGTVQEAWMGLAADTSYRLWVNDRLIFHGPLREVSPYFYYDVVDLKSHLKPGNNSLRVLVHYQGIPSGSYDVAPPGLLVSGEIRATEKVNLDGSTAWSARQARRYQSGAHRLGGCIGFSEHVDFSVKEDEWSAPIATGIHPTPEKSQPLVRDLPVLEGADFTPVSTEPQGKGVLCDFGQEVFGFIELDFEVEQKTEIHLTYAEALTNGAVDHRKQGIDYRDVLTVPAGRHSWRSYEKRAFRYLQFSKSVKIHSLQVTEAHYPYEHRYRKTEKSSDPLVKRILEVSARTIELCSDDLLNDCPWRERAQYFDCFFYMEAMQKLFGTLEPVKRFLRQYARGVNAEGILRMSYPSPANNTIIPDFSLSYAVQLDKYLELSGDRETVEKYYPYAQNAVRQFHKYEDEDGVLKDVPGWIFLDNGFELIKHPRSAGLNAVYAGAHRSLARIARVLGNSVEAASYEAEFQRVRAGFRKTFWTGSRLLDGDRSQEFEPYHYWNYHHSAETGHWQGKSLILQTTFSSSEAAEPTLRVMFHGGCRVWVDGTLALSEKCGGSWTRSALFEPHELAIPADGKEHKLQIELEFSGIEWEFFLSSLSQIVFGPCQVWETEVFGEASVSAPARGARTTTLKPYFIPQFSQVTTGYSVYHGLLEKSESKALLRRCLPENYYSAYAKRTTPFFVKITEDAELLRHRVVPCNVPASLFYFCHSLREHDMEDEARKLLLPIYSGMLERGATTWWEEWERRSSLCHAWAAFGSVFFMK